VDYPGGLMEVDIGVIQEFSQRIKNNLSRVIVGKDAVLELIVIGLLCQGHLLIEDVPGVGKTMLARSLAKSINCTFSRIQFTPDMLPSDVTGVSIFNQVSRQFEFRPGPLMNQIVLADEINRATPKTQSALLEGMEERQVTVDGVTYPLPKPFMVLATQNPIEYEGTFPLPEAQLDRFLMRIKLGYPSITDEIHILELQQIQHPIETLESIATVSEVTSVQQLVKRIYVAQSIKRYIVDLIRSTRGGGDVYLGSSPRGSLSLFRVSQARAAIHGRDFVLPDDVKILAEGVLSHRIVVDPAARLRDISAESIIQEIVRVLPVPGSDASRQSEI
jgi:MoxR-like ATPase